MKVKTVEIVSLSAGTIGEPSVQHETKLGVERLRAMGLQVRFSAHALSGKTYIKDHPEARAEDLLSAYRDPEVDMILCAIGGDDTYRLLPYLFKDDALKKCVNDKIFLGFSDTTINHLMLHKLGVRTFYGQSFLADICELDKDLLPYTRQYFEELIQTGTIREIRPSTLWYEERTAFGEDRIGVPRVCHPNTGFDLLQGSPCFSGKILGGCIESIYDLFDTGRYPDTVSLAAEYGLFPPLSDWAGRILLLETSEEKPSPAYFAAMLRKLKAYGLFDVVSGVLVGKPMDEYCHREYKKLLVDIIDKPDLPVVCNLSIGHATPRCIIPFGVEAAVDADRQRIVFQS